MKEDTPRSKAIANRVYEQNIYVEESYSDGLHPDRAQLDAIKYAGSRYAFSVTHRNIAYTNDGEDACIYDSKIWWSALESAQDNDYSLLRAQLTDEAQDYITSFDDGLQSLGRALLHLAHSIPI